MQRKIAVAVSFELQRGHAIKKSASQLDILRIVKKRDCAI